MTFLSWFLVPIAFAFGVGSTSFLCMFLLSLLDSIYPVATTMVGKPPSSSLDSVLASATLSIGCIIGAAITVLLPAFFAPKYKKETAHLVLVLGAVISGVIFLGTGTTIFIPAYLAALGAGIASVSYVGRASQLRPNISPGTDTQQL